MDTIYRTIKAQYEFVAAKAVQVENLVKQYRNLKLGTKISLFLVFPPIFSIIF